MKKYLKCAIFLSFFLFGTGCSQHPDIFQRDVMQILWLGDYNNGGSDHDISVMFDSESSGYYIFEDEVFGFSYQRNDKTIQI